MRMFKSYNCSASKIVQLPIRMFNSQSVCKEITILRLKSYNCSASTPV